MKDLKFEVSTNEELSYTFDRIAKLLLQEYLIGAWGPIYRIREIEFYYHSKFHSDPYCHRNVHQLSNSTLYFHRFTKPETYKNQKRKGIDITIGNGLNYGGILLRCIEDFRTKEIIQGPGKVANRIIEDMGGYGLVERLMKPNFNIFDNRSGNVVYIVKVESNHFPIYKKQRLGLKPEKYGRNKDFLIAKYNYSTYPELEILN